MYATPPSVSSAVFDSSSLQQRNLTPRRRRPRPKSWFEIANRRRTKYALRSLNSQPVASKVLDAPSDTAPPAMARFDTKTVSKARRILMLSKWNPPPVRAKQSSTIVRRRTTVLARARTQPPKKKNPAVPKRNVVQGKVHVLQMEQPRRCGPIKYGTTMNALCGPRQIHLALELDDTLDVRNIFSSKRRRKSNERRHGCYCWSWKWCRRRWGCCRCRFVAQRHDEGRSSTHGVGVGATDGIDVGTDGK